MVLRALENREAFGAHGPILDSLVRSVGLFPYANPDALNLPDLLAYEFHRPLEMRDDTVFHRAQAEVYRRLLGGENVILSAPTSFGKSRIIDALIAVGRYRNIVVVVPTLALIDETRRRLAKFSDRYKIVTHLSQGPGDQNVFVLTAERAIAYREFPKIDFFVIDEFYKIGAIEEDDKSRVVALNQAFYRLRKHDAQFYLLGPNVERIPEGLEETFRCSFVKTKFQTVVTEVHPVTGTGDAEQRLVTLAKSLSDPTLAFCSSPPRVNRTAEAFLDGGVGVDTEQLRPAADWISRTFHHDWIFGRALLRGIGIHHGKLPRALSQYVVRMFNEEKLRFLICTSTLIEGVNTKAKNVVVYDNKIAKQKINYFTFNNIKGRSGRMFEHFIGRVYIFCDPPEKRLPFVDFPLFTQSDSAPVSLLIQIDDEDLSKKAKVRVENIMRQQELPLSVLRENSSIDPEAQIALAREIAGSPARMSRNLAWTRFPSWEQLLFACNLIWKHFVGNRGRIATVASGQQLAFKIDRLRQRISVAEQVRQELVPGEYAAKDANAAAEGVLGFERTWAHLNSRVTSWLCRESRDPFCGVSAFLRGTTAFLLRK